LSSGVVCLIGCLALACKGSAWVDYLDPAVTIILSLAMSTSMKGVLVRSCHILMEGSITDEERLALYEALRGVAGSSLEVVSVHATELDFDQRSRRATVTLQKPGGAGTVPSEPLSLQEVEEAWKALSAKAGDYGVEWLSLDLAGWSKVQQQPASHQTPAPSPSSPLVGQGGGGSGTVKTTTAAQQNQILPLVAR